MLAQQKIDLLFVLAAAPGRGRSVRSDGSVHFASTERWQLLARSTAFVHGVYLVLANRVGSEGPYVFAGGSMIVGPDGLVIAMAPQEEEASITANMKLDDVRLARASFPHLRDEDAAFTADALRTLFLEQQA